MFRSAKCKIHSANPRKSLFGGLRGCGGEGVGAGAAGLNKDYLTVPVDEIGRLDPVLTVMNGRVTYSDPQFASEQGLPVVGYQGSRARWIRGAPEDTRGRTQDGP